MTFTALPRPFIRTAQSAARNMLKFFVLTMPLWFGIASAHNLNQVDTVLAFDKATLDLMATRSGTGQPILKAGDTVGVILKSTPGPGTATGAGGYMTFYIPPGTQVMNAEYGSLDSTGNFVAQAIKGPSIMAVGDGSIGLTATPGMIGAILPAIPGIGTPGLNAAGVQSTPVTASGSPGGTLAGVYGDTGIFYSTSPDTTWQSFTSNGGYDSNTGTSDNVLTNNRGVAMTPTTLWDAEQLIAYGLSSPSAPVIDPNGRGNTPWGLGSGVAGPQSGYAWAFKRSLYQTTGDMKQSIVVGPWQRIKYPGSSISKDIPGTKSTALGYATSDASSLGVVVNPANPLPPTLSLTDSTSPKAIRVSEGGLVLGHSEYARVQLKILADVGQPNSPFAADGCFEMNTEAFGGDAGGEQGGKDHLWRYYAPTTQTVHPCAMVQKVFTKSLIGTGTNSSFQIAVINTGVTAMNNVVVTDPMPAGLTYLSASPAPSSTSPLTWNLGTMAANSVKVITVNYTGSGTGTFYNVASMSATRAGIAVSASGTDSVTVGAFSDLTPTKSVTPSTVSPGGNVTYTMTITNDGSSTNGSPLVITENLPAGFTYQSYGSAQINGGAAASGVVTVNSSSAAAPVFTISQGIIAGKSLVITFTAAVSPGQATGVYGNSLSLNYESKVVSSGVLAPVTVGGGRIGDTVFRDWNGNGSQDIGEEGISGVTVQLYNGAGTTLLATTTTDANGTYLFNGLNAGTYQVRVTPPTDYVISSDPDGTLDSKTNVTLIANQQFLTADFGYKYDIASLNAASIGDFVFSDTNNNKVKDTSEVGIPLVTVNLYEDTNGNGVIDNGDLLIATMPSANGVTNDYNGDGLIDPEGFYLFKGLDPARKYIVKVDASDPDITTFFGNAAQQSTPAQVAVAGLTAGSTFDTADFGFFGIPPASIGDQVFIDNNGNGVFDAGDTPLSGVTVELYADANGDGVASPAELVTTTTTNASGIYSFTNLGPDPYIVKVKANDPNLPAGLIGIVAQKAVALTSGANITTADFPYLRFLTKLADKSFAVGADVITYTISPYYPGNTLLSNVLVSDPMPTGTTYNGSASPVPTSAPAIGGTGNVIWNLGSTTAAAGGTGATPAYSPSAQVVQTTATVDDSFIDENNKTQVNGTGNQLKTRPASGARKISLMRFSLPAFAATDVIDKAYVRVRVQTARSSNHTISLYRVTTPTPWVESSLNWDDPNGATAGTWTSGVFSSADYDSSTPYGSVTAPYSVGQELIFDVTTLVRGWRDGTITNDGVALVASGTDNGDVVFYSSEGGTAGSKPGPRLAIGVSSTGQATNATVWDKFGTALYNNNDGTNNWLGSWFESGDDGLPNSGNIKISGGVMVVKDVAGVSIQRAVDLAGVNAATLSLNLTQNTLNSASDKIAVQASNNAGVSWTTLETYTLGTATGVKSYNLITALGSVSANTRIRFARISSVGGTQQISVDDVKITFSTPAGPATGTTLAADTALLTGTRNVTVTMMATSSVAATVTPPANLTLALTGGATATKVGGPTPATDIADAAGAVFTWVYQVTAGTSPGSVRFSGAPSAPAGYSFGTANSQSVLVTPVLTFKAKVNNTPPAISVINIATITDSGGLNATATATTATSGSIGDFVWQDSNGNGLQDSGEPGLSGVRVYVDSNNNGVYDVGEPNAITDNAGAYRIYGLAAGTYNVRYDATTLPAGYTPSTATTLSVVLTGDQQYNTADFGLKQAASGPTASSIGDTVWLDTNNDGIVDASETRLSGITVKLYYDTDNSGTITPGDVLSGTTTTDSSGNYLFFGVNPGNYLVVVSGSDPSLPPGVTLVSGGASASGVQVVNLAASQNYTVADYGYNYSGKIGDTVYYDTNANGVQDVGEGLVTGAVVSLFNDVNHNGSFDPGVDTIVGTTSTNGSGQYLFSNLPPGDYIVVSEEQTVPAPPGSPHAGLTGFMVGTTDTKLAVTLTPAAITVLTADFGYIEGAFVEGHVFHDANHNGVLDPGESPLPNVTVTLTGFDSNGVPVNRTTITNASGVYSFLPPAGTYAVTYDTADTDIPAALSDRTTPISYSFIAASGDEIGNLNFGRDNSGIIGDTIFADADGNGSQGSGESGLQNVTVMLLDSTGTTLIDTAVTDSVGHYYFRGLADGTYKVQVLTSSLPANYGTTPTADPDAVKDSIGTATIVGGGSVLTVDFGYKIPTPTFSVSGVVWDDNGAGGGGAGNGIKAGTEPGLASVTVTAGVDTNADGTVDQTLTTTTDGTGAYSFAGILSGSNVTITVNSATLPNAAYVQTGDPDVTKDNKTTITNLIANASNKNFGYNQSFGSIAGKYVIGNGNGMADVGEAGLNGVTMTLTFAGADGILGTADDTIQTTTTSVSGAYSFSNLLPGSYQITKVTNTPAGYASLADSDGANPDNISATLAVGQNLTAQDFEARAVLISGKVWDDANGSANNTFTNIPSLGETGTNAGATLYAILVDGSGNVAKSTAVANDGTYGFSTVPPANYTIRLATSTCTVGQPAPAAAVPAAWTNTSPLAYTAFAVAATDVTGKDFGIEQLPTANSVNALLQNNPGGANKVTVPTLSGSDPEDVTVTTFMIKTLPGNGTLYYNNVAVTVGQIISSYNSSLLKLDPNDGSITVSFTYAAIDAASKESTPATVTMPFTAIDISGKVFDDADGLLGTPANTVNGTGSNAGGTLYANLVTGGNVSQSIAVAADGTYSFGTVVPNTSYTVVLSTTQGTVGNPAPAAALPGGWVNTGENLGTGAGSDGTIDGSLAVAVTTSSVPNANFGIEQLPTANNVSAAAQFNPGGTSKVTVPALSGSDPEDATVSTFVITTLPSNGLLYYTGAAVTAGQTITGYNATLLTLDPNDGAITCTFDYASIDAAGKGSPQATVTMPFTDPLANPRAGCYNNLLKTSFGLDSGTNVLINGEPFQLVRVVDGTKPAGYRIDAKVREMSGLSNTTFTMEYISSLSASGANGAGWSSLGVSPNTTTSNGDGTVTATYQDVETLTGLTAGQGFMRVKVTYASVSSRTGTWGWSRRTATQNVCQTFSMPYTDGEIFCGTIDAASGGTLTLTTSAGSGNLKTAMQGTGRSYYIEVVNGTKAGHRFEVDVNASTANTLVLAASSPLNTLSPVPALSAGDFIKLHSHWTLDELFDKTKFNASIDSTTADKLTFFNRNTQVFEVYYLVENISAPVIPRKWVLDGDATLTDAGGRLFDPAEAMFVTARSSNPNIDQLFTGAVRSHAFAAPLKTGSNFIGGGWPMDQSPVSRAMLAAGFTGSPNPALADLIQNWQSDSTGTSASTYIPNFLLKYQALNQWSPRGVVSAPNLNNTSLFKSQRGAMIRSISGLPAYVMPLPWTP